MKKLAFVLNLCNRRNYLLSCEKLKKVKACDIAARPVRSHLLVGCRETKYSCGMGWQTKTETFVVVKQEYAPKYNINGYKYTY